MKVRSKELRTIWKKFLSQNSPHKYFVSGTNGNESQLLKYSAIIVSFAQKCSCWISYFFAAIDIHIQTELHNGTFLGEFSVTTQNGRNFYTSSIEQLELGILGDHFYNGVLDATDHAQFESQSKKHQYCACQPVTVGTFPQNIPTKNWQKTPFLVVYVRTIYLKLNVLWYVQYTIKYSLNYFEM